jgi:hypothetical protein
MEINYYKDNTPTHKRCSMCKKLKPRTEFYKESSRKDGITGYCKPCKLEKTKKWREQNPEKMKAHIDSRIWYRREKLYGLSKENFFKILEKQNYECKICKLEINDRCHVDHCHDTGRVRGLLCGNCNAALGLFKDNTEILKNAIKYLVN